MFFKYAKIKLLLLLLMCMVTRTPAQQYNFHNYSVKEGVAQSQVYALLQDSRGYLWMGTRGGGITRFDGTTFKTFTVKEGLANNYISCIKEDDQHNLWIGTNNGLSYYNGIVFKTIAIPCAAGQPSIYGIDKDSKGRIWLASNMGVILIDKAVIRFVTDELNYKKKSVFTLLCDKQDKVWFGNSEGLFRLAEEKTKFSLKKFKRADGFMNNSVNCLATDKHNKLWIGTYGDGVYVYKNKKFQHPDTAQELNKQTVLAVLPDNDNVWLATLNGGVAQYNTVAKSFSWFTEKEGLSNNHVRCIIKDNSGNYWFGTSGGGVCDFSGKQFTVFDKSSGLAGNFIYSIYRDARQRLWIGTSDKGISLYDSSRFYNFNSGNGFIDTKVKAIQEDNFGTLYFGTDGQGLYTYDGIEFKKIEALDKKYIRAIVKDTEGNLYIATAGAGLFKMIIQEDHYEIIHYTDKDGLLNNRLTCLFFEPGANNRSEEGKLWYGTENNGVGLLLNGQIQSKTLSTGNGLPSNSIRSITADARGNIWLATAGDGIACVSLNNAETITKYNHTNGLSSSNIYLLCFDSKGNLFAGSETGLDHIILGKENKPVEIKHYSKGEGFTGIETCQNAVFKDLDGTIWFGTINGLIKYNPANTVRNLHEPITTINNLKLFYEPLSNTPYKNFIGDWNSVVNLHLPYNQNHLTFDFIAINFSNPYAVKYQWKLEGFDQGWSPVSEQHTFSYPNLSAGEYTFMVKACNEDGVWNKKPVSLKFYISPPFWLRWWFILLVSVIVIAIFVFGIKWRINRIKAKAKEEQKKVQMEKEMLELEQKALRLQMNPHFIFNALNSIQSQIGADNAQTARYYLAKFSRLMRQILDNSRQSSISLEEEISTLENYLLIEKFCNGDRFDYKINVDEAIETDYVKIPPMLLQPFIENSIKHGLKLSEEKRGYIEVKFEEKNNLLECSVSDNGIGRKKAEELNQKSKETYHRSTALIVTRERLDLLQNNKSYNSLEIIDLYDKEGNACGTKVIVRIPLE